MLDIRATAYISPVAEMDFASVPLTVRIANVADETGLVTGAFRVYNDNTGTLIHTSEIVPFSLAAGQTVDVSALTDFDPPAPLDDVYFVLFDGNASNALVPDGIGIHLGAFHFDVKPVGMGPAPAAHHATHEDGGSDEVHVEDLPTLELDDTLVLMPDAVGGIHWQPLGGGGGPHAATHENGGADEINVAGLSGELADAQKPKAHKTSHENGGTDELSVAGLSGELADDQPPKAHHATHEDGGGDEVNIEDQPTTEMDDTLVLAPDGAGGVEFRAETGGAGTPSDTVSDETTYGLTPDAGVSDDYSRGDHTHGTPARPDGYFTDFEFTTTPASTRYRDWISSVIATGTISPIAGTPNHPGIQRFANSATINSGGIYRTDTNAFLIAGSEETTFIFRPQTLAGAILRMGFNDSTTVSTPVDGIYVLMAQVAGVDGVIVGRCISNSVATETATNYTLVTNTWYRIKISVNAAANLVTFTLYSEAGAVLWTDTVNSNIPTAAGRETGHAFLAYNNTAAAAGDVADIDYMSLHIARTLTR